MESFKLQNRVDTKYVFNKNKLADVLQEIYKHYNILEIDGNRMNHYRSVYYDTENLQFFQKHATGKMNRYKVRMRKYLDSGLCFLEIKFKTNKGRTLKSRMKKPDFELRLSNDSIDYIGKKSKIKENGLSPSLWNNFSRITLVHKQKKERLTIDLDLRYNQNNKMTEVKDIVIAELKQEKFSVLSDFVKAMRKFHIRPMRISKYCLGISLMYKNIKDNRFKPRILYIKKITNGAAFRYSTAG